MKKILILVLLLIGIPNSSFAEQSEFGGIGFQIKMENGFVKILSIIEGSPAYKSGIKEGDYIIQINNNTVSDLTLPEVLELTRGKKGTKVNLTISRIGSDLFELEIIRDIIKIQSNNQDQSSTNMVQSVAIGVLNNKCNLVLEKIEKEANNNLAGKENNYETIMISLEEAMYGFLSGLNFGIVKDPNVSMKNVWHDFENTDGYQKEKIFSYLFDNCKKNPNSKLWMVMVHYYATLEDYKK